MDDAKKIPALQERAQALQEACPWPADRFFIEIVGHMVHVFDAKFTGDILTFFEIVRQDRADLLELEMGAHREAQGSVNDSVEQWLDRKGIGEES